MKLGFIGMGLMGVPMSKRLLDAGFDVTVFNRNGAKCQPVVDLGSKQAQSLEEVTTAVDVLMMCISNTQSVEDVIRQILPSIKSNQIIVDFSSIAPDATQELAKQVEAKGGFWIDSPVSGGVAGAEAGSLAIMAGGRSEVLAKVQPYLKPLSQRVTHMGPNGSGQTTKVCNQMLVSCNVLVMAEVMAMAKKAGVDASQIPVALKGGFADSTPLQLTGPKMAEQDFDEIKWHVKTLLKDLDMAGDLSKALQTAIPMAGLGAELMRQHASKGYADQDPATLVGMYEDIKKADCEKGKGKE